MSVKLYFGWRAGRLVHISEVDKGLACRCVCPACGNTLIARKGAKYIHHFAHHHHGPCVHGRETAVHLLAKQILKEERRLYLPPVRLLNWKRPVFPARMVTLNRVHLEYPLDNIVPDLLVRVRRKWLLIELAVTNRVGPEKVRRIRRMKAPALEIDLREIIGRIETRRQDFLEAAFRHALIYGANSKAWLYNPRKDRLEKSLRSVAVVRKVRTSHWKGRYSYTVRPCPLRKRLWRPHLGCDASYARVFQDCLHCPYGLEIRYREEWRGGRDVSTLPEEVVCFGTARNRLSKAGPSNE